MAVGDGKAYIFPTLKGLVSEGEQVAEAYELIRPDVLCVSLSDRELAEVRFAIRDAGETEVSDDYVPESPTMRRLMGVGGDEPEDEPEEGEGTPLDEVMVPSGVASREEVEQALDEPFAPDLLAADSAARSDQIFISDSDMAYSQRLATFGDVELPAPSFVEAVRRADADGVPVVDIDLTDDEYTQVFVDHVSYWQLVSHSRKVRAMKKGLKAGTPKQMAEQWDARVRRVKGFDVLERERERKMAVELLDQLKAHTTVLAVIDHVRVGGVLKQLAALLEG